VDRGRKKEGEDGERLAAVERRRRSPAGLRPAVDSPAQNRATIESDRERRRVEKLIRVRADPVRSHRFVSPKMALESSIASDGQELPGG
jgi:hypothetical protein